MAEQQKQGFFANWFSRAEKSLPKPTGERLGIPATARRMHAPTREELEHVSRDGTECEAVVRMPGYRRFEVYLAQQIEEIRKNLETGDFGKENEGLKAAQAKLDVLRRCANWMPDEIKRGEEARAELSNGGSK